MIRYIAKKKMGIVRVAGARLVTATMSCKAPCESVK